VVPPVPAEPPAEVAGGVAPVPPPVVALEHPVNATTISTKKLTTRSLATERRFTTVPFRLPLAKHAIARAPFNPIPMQ
jgi:hypothetical protein